MTIKAQLTTQDYFSIESPLNQRTDHVAEVLRPQRSPLIDLQGSTHIDVLIDVILPEFVLHKLRE